MSLLQGKEVKDPCGQVSSLRGVFPEVSACLVVQQLISMSARGNIQRPGKTSARAAVAKMG